MTPQRRPLMLQTADGKTLLVTISLDGPRCASLALLDDANSSLACFRLTRDAGAALVWELNQLLGLGVK